MTNPYAQFRIKSKTFVLVASLALSMGSSAWGAGPKAKPTAKPAAKSSSGSGPSFFENLPPPEGIRIYDIVVGPRIGIGSYASASVGFGLNGEYLITREIGVGGFFGYSTYSTTSGPGSFKYTNLLFGAQGSYHANVFKVQNLDTFATLGLGYNVVSASWSGTGIQPVAVSASGIVALLYVSGRYFFNEQWAATGSLGFGAGILSVGVDYKF